MPRAGLIPLARPRPARIAGRSASAHRARGASQVGPSTLDLSQKRQKQPARRADILVSGARLVARPVQVAGGWRNSRATPPLESNPKGWGNAPAAVIQEITAADA